MGRVSRYRKVKACDPFYKGPRRDLKHDNLRPENEEDQPVPKSFTRLMKSVELASMPRKKKRKIVVTGDPQRSTSAQTTTRVKQKASSSEQAEDDGGVPVFRRRKGESLKSYLDRIDVETNSRIMESYRRNRKMSDRRRQYLDERRRKLKSKRTEDEEAHIDFSDLRDEVKFGEVVSAPPRLSAQPRGAQKSDKKRKTLLLQEKLNPVRSDVVVAKQQHPVALKRKHDLEIERKKAIDTYRLAKKAKLSRSEDRTLHLVL